MLNTQTQTKELNIDALSVDAFDQLKRQDDVFILDTRDPEIFRTAFIPQSISLGLGNNFAPWVTRIFPDQETKIVLVCESDCLYQCVALLHELGYKNIEGYLDGGIEAWTNSGKKTESIQRLCIDEFSKLCQKEMKIVDVRRDVESYSQHVSGAENISLDNLIEGKASFDNEPCVLYCQGGYRSMIVASFLKQKGYENIMDVEGGFSEIIEHDIELTAYKSPTSFEK